MFLNIKLLSVLLFILNSFLFNIIITAQGLPPNFQLVQAFPTLGSRPFNGENPVQIVFLPDGRKLIPVQDGRVWIINNQGNSKTIFIDLSQKVLRIQDKGLLGVAIDPDFEINKWIYFLYQVDPDSNNIDNNLESWGRLERYKLSTSNPNIADISSRQILIGNNWADGIPYTARDNSHSIGTIRFGRDKTLLLSAGDGAEYQQPDPGGLNPDAFTEGKLDPSQDMGAFRAQSLNSLSGKILRIDKETGLGLPSNPFWDGNSNSVRSRVWSYGLRNPFRFAIKTASGSLDPGARNPGTLFIGDVGNNTYEELNIDINGGLNFGWPKKEGPASFANPDYQNINSVYNGNTNVINPGNPENPAQYTYPVYYWEHFLKNQPSNPNGWEGNTAIGGTVYMDTTYPSEYRNNLFISDFTGQWLRRIKLDANDNVTGNVENTDWYNFANQNQIETIVNWEVDPLSGEIYLVRLFGAVDRIRYGSNSNPIIIADVYPAFGLAPLQITADASDSYDPEGNNLSYTWDFGNGDFAFVDSTTYTFQNTGNYNVILTISDGAGGESINSFPIVVGQANPPVANIIFPSDSSFFDLNQNGTFQAENVDSSTYQWNFELSHNDNHTHLYGTIFTNPANWVLNVPDHPTQAGVKYHWIAILKVTKGSLSSYDTVEVFPKINLFSEITNNPDPSLNDTYNITVTVKNNGEVPSASGTLKLFKNGQLKESLSFVGIPQNVDSIYNFIDTADTANITIKAIIDQENNIYETDETDNELEVVIPVNPFPVELISFTGVYQNNSIILKWATATEIDNFGFEIEKRISDQGNSNWNKIGFVNGNGNSNSPKNYQFIDSDLKGGIKFSYRLKQIDTDGTFEYFKSVEVEKSLPDEFELSQNYPNPFNPETVIEFSIPQAEFVKLEIYNILGNKVATVVNEKREPGRYSEVFNGENIASGIYFYIMQAGEFSQSRKLMILK